MKTNKGILAGLILALTMGINVYASGGSEKAKATNNLKRQIQKEFRTLPFEDVVGLEESSVLELSFQVNEDNTLEVLKIESENEDLVHHANIILKDCNVQADEILAGHKYHITMRFVDKN